MLIWPQYTFRQLVLLSGLLSIPRITASKLVFIIDQWYIRSSNRGNSASRLMVEMPDIALVKLTAGLQLTGNNVVCLGAGVDHKNTNMCINMLGPFSSTHWLLGDAANNFKSVLSNSCYRLNFWASPVKLISGACQRITLVISQHWLR